MQNAVVQLFAYDEPDTIWDTMDAVADEPVPDGWSVSYEAWVTPAEAPPDPTMLLARDHPTFEAREAPDGKLSTRNEAHDAALQRGQDAFVVWDADTMPSQTEPLRRLLSAVEEPGVVAANSKPRAPLSATSVVTNVAASIRRTVTPYMHGQASAITTDAWRQVGPFDTGIDQSVMNSVWHEEERRLYKRLSTIGRVARPKHAVVFEPDRRARCTIEDVSSRAGVAERSRYCGRRGGSTFQPKRRK